ncbi:MAG: DNA mismatch repair protein MutS [Bacteroidia bacterium]
MPKPKDVVETPLMKQYYQIKGKHPDALLLFRVGDFYETFGEDAKKAAEILGIALTKRANGKASHVALAGFPYHSLDTYLPKLIRSGQRVAICEQLEDPKKTKTIVQRGVTDIVTPGTSVDDKMLENKQNNFLAAVHFEEDIMGVALLDLSTGEFLTTEGQKDYIETLLQSFKPSEVVFSKDKQGNFEKQFGNRFYTFVLEDWLFNYDYAREKLISQFKTKNLKGFGIESMKAGIVAAGVALHYLSENKHNQLPHINRIRRLEPEKYVWLDRFTIRNLELLDSYQIDGTPLIKVVDRTLSPMGSRLMKQWLVIPLKELRPILERQNIVEHLFQNSETTEALEQQLNSIGDLERLISKVGMQRINPRELNQVMAALNCIREIKRICTESGNENLMKVAEQMNPCDSVCDKIGSTLQDDPPVNITKGELIRDGISEELDEYRNLTKTGKQYLVDMQQKEIGRTGISSLKIGFNSVFGYYLEVTHKHKDKVPEEWVRKQTLVNSERYITDELKEYEEKILNAEEKILEVETQLYQDLVFYCTDYIQPVQQNANLAARLDCLLAFATVARDNNYVKPEVNTSHIIEIKDGRHPVIEQRLPMDEEYIPNDVYLDNDTQQLIILTGPNMSGKSALLRQTALIVLLAQCGAFVPAKEARIGLVDKIFTRVGASDNLSSGESTFMVEMIESASILNNLSKRSLILLDEIGRGTSTYDGISIAWAITEYLHANHFKPKTLFATHYHELNEISKKLKRVKNFHVSVKEVQDKVIFLRKMLAGGSEHSFGIHVAQMAGMPEAIVKRSKEILVQLESQRESMDSRKKANGKQIQPQVQLSLFEYDDPAALKLKEEFQKIEIDSMTPIEALMKLNYLKSLLGKG